MPFNPTIEVTYFNGTTYYRYKEAYNWTPFQGFSTMYNQTATHQLPIIS